MATMTSRRYTSPEPIRLDGLDRTFSRADIEFTGVGHDGASYEARVFLNNPDADGATPLTSESGYAGSYHIFGHGGCFGDVGHCDVRERRRFDPRPAHHLSPARKVVIATEAVRRAQAAGPSATVTVVPVISSLTPKASVDDVLKFERVAIVTYR